MLILWISLMLSGMPIFTLFEMLAWADSSRKWATPHCKYIVVWGLHMWEAFGFASLLCVTSDDDGPYLWDYCLYFMELFCPSYTGTIKVKHQHPVASCVWPRHKVLHCGVSWSHAKGQYLWSSLLCHIMMCFPLLRSKHFIIWKQGRPQILPFCFSSL